MSYSGLRKFPRINSKFPVTYKMDDATGRAPALTLGGGGLFIGMAEALSPGTEMAVRFRAAKHLPLIEARARVCYQLPGKGVGIEFTEIASGFREQILRLIHRRIGEKRRYPRSPFATQVEHDTGMFIGFSKDISTKGMFIETRETLPVGSTLQIRFHIDENGPICRTKAEVRYEVKKLGIGVEFIEMPPPDQSRIESYLVRAETH